MKPILSLKRDTMRVPRSFHDKVRRLVQDIISSEYFNYLVVALAALLMSGVIYAVVEQPRVMWGDVFFYPSTLGQTWAEVIIIAMSYMLCFIGMYLIYKSHRYLYEPKHASIMMIVGTLILFVSLVLLMIIYGVKRGW
ncbi:MAG: hypothetical protein DRJ32_01210 [Thermoprotei archaeon]|nr:MAG: hypothetical protein DRJ32_01210 [Thermoprotei archaeon]HDD64234.1 hypothetical protein [Thermoprotei archaeon]